jgi:hypothetical protein
MSNAILADGTVLSSQNWTHDAFHNAENMLPMVGVILSVQPSDAQGNYLSESNINSRGSRNVCTVLAASGYEQPNLLLTNVVIPPASHSGIDNYEENLPRGLTGMIDPEKVRDLDLYATELDQVDAEWCIVGFVGGRLENPFVMNWWPHPSDNIHPATTGRGYKDKALTQYDLQKNRSRWVRQKNGSLLLLNREGSVYLDTMQAGRRVDMKDGTFNTSQVEKGGHVQLDVKSAAQLEINWNSKEDKGPRIGAGSDAKVTVQSRSFGSDDPILDQDLPHHDQPVTGTTPKTRPVERTHTRWREYDILIKTSKLVVACDAQGDFEGEIAFVVDKLLEIKSGADIKTDAAATTTQTSGSDHVIDSPLIHLGSSGATEPFVLGTQWLAMMTQFMAYFQTHTHMSGLGPTSPVLPPELASVATLQGNLPQQLSTFIFGQKSK